MTDRKPRPPSPQLAIFDTELSNPDSNTIITRKNNFKSNSLGISNPAAEISKKTPRSDNRQPALPGIAVRGRPRLRVKPTASERAARSRRTREAAGAKRVELMLSPRTVAGLDALARLGGETRAQVIARLVEASLRRRRIAVEAPKQG